MNITISTTSTLVAAHIGKVSAATGSAYKGIAISFLIEEVKRQMRQGICHFIYRKADGSIREAFGTLDKEVLAKTLNGAGQSPETWLLPRCPCRRGEEFPLGKFGGGFVIVEEGGGSQLPHRQTIVVR